MSTTTTNSSFNPTVDELRARINHRLDSLLQTRHTLDKAMRYSTLNGGKRFRALLTYSTGLCFNAPINELDFAALAVELIHCFSLIHDDLPAMDDDDLRRGQPACHKRYDEATAILAGDALHSLAFQVLCHSTLTSDIKINMISELTLATGTEGMTYGQLLDIEAEGKMSTLTELDRIHERKTGALIEAAVALGGYIARCNADEITALKLFGRHLGLAFQIKDDLLEQQSDTLTLGKSTLSDITKQKTTYPRILGEVKSQQRLNDVHQKACDALQKISTDTSRLEHLLDWCIKRKH